MALVSPGVEVTVIDQSTYVPSVAGTVPYILIATATNKPSGADVGIATGTLKENANKVYLITSQRDLLAKYGNPIFTDNGAETNEYGLLAAYSALGVSNRCYVQRVDVDLSAIKGSLVRPSFLPQTDAWYLDVNNTRWGFNVWSWETNTFTYQEATILTNPANIDNSTPSQPKPAQAYGKGGDIAIVGTDINLVAWQKVKIEQGNPGSYWAGINGTWQPIGSLNWAQSFPWAIGVPGPLNFTSPQKIQTANGLTQEASPTNSIVEAVNSWNNFSSSQGVDGGLAYSINPNTNQYTLLAYGDLTLDPVFNFQIQTAVLWQGNQASQYGFVDGTVSPFAATWWLMGIYQPGKNYTYPAWNSRPPEQRTVPGQFDTYSSPTGSIWQNVTPGIDGADVVFKRWNPTLKTYTTQRATMYYNNPESLSALDPTGGGFNIPIDTLYTQYDTWDSPFAPSWPPAGGLPLTLESQQRRSALMYPGRYARHNVFRRYAVGPTNVTGATPAATTTGKVTIRVSSTVAGSSEWYLGTSTQAINSGSTMNQVVIAINNCGAPNAVASLNGEGKIVISHTQGGSVMIQVVYDIGTSTLGDAEAFFTQIGFSDAIQGCYRVPLRFPTTFPQENYLREAGTYASATFSNWNQLTYGLIANDEVEYAVPPNNTLWYWSDPTQADIMIQNNGQWVGYRTVTNSIRGENLTLTNATGPMFAATAPTVQSAGGGPLKAGDLWIDTSDLENYPALYRWTVTTSKQSWVRVDINDKFSTAGVLFADARWAPNGTTNPATDPVPSITSLLTSNYLDLDAPNPALSPQGVLLWNTRRSGYNVKSYQVNYFSSANFPNKTLPTQRDTWLSVSGNKPNGAAYLGRQAQRSMVIQAMRAGVDTSVEAREEQKDINLLAAPQYPELAPNLNSLNIERGDTGFVIIDTPLRLTPDDIVNWATNNNGLGLATADGLLIGDPYAASWYPSCLTTDLSGNQVVTAPSHMILRTILQSDRESYPWIASAGTQRGVVDNALQIGYLKAQTNTFESISVRQGLRDVLYTNRINPITVIPGTGIVNFGNKTTTGFTSALDRVNVARLVAFLRRRLAEVAEQYLFEPNDEITRNSVKNVIDSLMIDLVAKRALYDYLVVCDLSNNTPDRIDRNELWIDIAIEPVKAVEFIYIPVRIKNTGAIAAGL